MPRNKTYADCVSGRRIATFLLFRVVVVLVALGTLNFTAWAEDAPPLEHKVKAACLFNFAVNTEWPADAFTGADAPLVIGLVGEVPFGPLLERGVQGKFAQGRKIEVRAITETQASQCHLIFVAPSESARLPSLVRSVAGKPVLLVGEADGFARRGGIVNFVKVEGSVKFEVNTTAAERSRLKLGSQMLKLAIMIKSASFPGMLHLDGVANLAAIWKFLSPPFASLDIGRSSESGAIQTLKETVETDPHAARLPNGGHQETI